MTQLEFYKSFQFMTELLVAESLFCVRLQRRAFFPLRLLGCVVACFLFSWLFPLPFENSIWLSLMFFLMFSFTVACSFFLFKEAPIKIIFCLIAGYTTQHLAYEIHNLGLNLMGVSASSPMGFYSGQSIAIFSNPLLLLYYLWIYTFAYFFVWLIFGRKIERGEKFRMQNGYVFLFVVIILAVDIILNAVVVYNIASDGNTLYMIIVGIYNILCCVFALFLQFEVTLRRKLQMTLETVQQLRYQEKEQYTVSKENIALINMKCHDLKHQIREIGSSGSLNAASVAEIEKLISIYDSAVKTDNDALDIILTEKSLLCNKNGIKLSCIVDGKRLNFMTEEDIYSLFGNLIDNAIEAVLHLGEEKRVIGLRVRAMGKFVSVNVHNFYEHEIRFVDGVPQTTKSDKEYHGFGMRSIQYVCEKYNGHLSINAENGVFNINILFVDRS